MTDACLCCPVLRRSSTARRPNRPKVCDGCRKRLAADLAAIGPAYADLDPTPVRGVSEIRSRVYGPRAPLDLDELSLEGPGEGTPRYILGTECRDWAETFGLELPMDSVTVMAEWLGRHLELACDEHPAIDEFAEKIRQIAGELHIYEREADKAGTRVGRCPRLGSGEVTPCGAPLACDPYDAVITCPRCGTSWHRDRQDKHGVPGWIKLKAAQLEREGQISA